MLVEPAERNEVRDFIEEHHYSRNINGLMSSYCFKLMHEGKMIGAMIYGSLGMANAWKKYATAPGDVVELRRLVLVDDTPANAESFFIAKTLRWLKQHTNIKTVVSYADPNHGHSGIVYKASNFRHQGMTAKGRVIKWGDKQYHDKAIRTKYKGELKPFAVRLKNALDNGEAYYEDQLPKHIYVFDLDVLRKPKVRASSHANAVGRG